VNNPNIISESLETNFLVKYFNYYKHPGSATLQLPIIMSRIYDLSKHPDLYPDSSKGENFSVPEPHVFRPPGSGSISQWYGSGS
jgi:hypothetical protein